MIAQYMRTLKLGGLAKERRSVSYCDDPEQYVIEVGKRDVEIHCHLSISFLRNFLILVQEFRYIATDCFRHNDRPSVSIMAKFVAY